MKIVSYGQSDTGRRGNNEDYYIIDEELGLHLVCDGMGGHEGGEVASETAALAIQRVLRSNLVYIKRYEIDSSFENRDLVTRLIEHAVQVASTEVANIAVERGWKLGTGTTVAMILTVGENAIVAHAGDSRVYLLRNKQVYLLTEDHSVINEQIRKGTMTREEAMRSPHAHAITRAVGLPEFVHAETLHIEFAPGDICLICSDGLSEFLRSDTLVDFAHRVSLRKLPKSLITHAFNDGSQDNITAVVIGAKGQGDVDPRISASKKMSALQHIPLFQHLTFKESLKVLATAGVRTYEAGQLVCEEGGASDAMFILLAGNVCVSKQGQTIAQLEHGAFFGEMGLIDNAPRSASVMASDAAKVMVIRRERFYRLLRQQPELAVKLLWAFCGVLNDRLRATNEQLSDARTDLERMRDDRPFFLPDDEATDESGVDESEHPFLS